MTINTLETCNACDAAPMAAHSLAGYCKDCEAEARGACRQGCGEPAATPKGDCAICAGYTDQGDTE